MFVQNHTSKEIVIRMVRGWPLPTPVWTLQHGDQTEIPDMFLGFNMLVGETPAGIRVIFTEPESGLVDRHGSSL